jgi:PAS domain S-box-containing protein
MIESGVRGAVDQRRQKFKSMQMAGQRLQQIVDFMPVAMVLIDQAGLIEMVNAQTETLFGYAPGSLVGQPIEMLMPERFHSRNLSMRNSFFAAPGEWPMEDQRDFYALRKDQSEFPVEVRPTPIETDEGLMVLAAIVDVSARKRLEDRIRRVVEFMPNAVVMLTQTLVIEMINAEAERLFNYPRGELIGRHLEILIPDRFRGQCPCLQPSYFQDPKPTQTGKEREFCGRRKNGTEVPVEMWLNPIESEDGMIILATIVDISDRKREEKHFQASSEKDLLLGEIHHRVKNNLQIVDSLLDLQSSRISDPVVRGTLRDCQNRIRSMALIHQTLYQSKDFADVDFSHFLDALLPILISSFGTDPNRVKLVVDAATVRLPIKLAIPCGLIVNELMSNALKHAFGHDRYGEITLRLALDADGEVTLTFSDDGVGIPADLDLETTKTLGLRIISLLAKQVHGALTVERAHPTQFVLRFPVRQ